MRKSFRNLRIIPTRVGAIFANALRLGAAAVALLFPQIASAHLVTTGLGPVYDGIGHFALSPDDLFPVLAAALLAGMRGPTAGRRALFALPLAWLVGGLTGIVVPHQMRFPLQCFSFLLLGILIASDRQLPASLVATIVAGVGLVHGYFNGVAMSEAGTSTAVLQLTGVAVALFVLIAIFASLVVSLWLDWQRIVVRVAGSWIAAIGLLLLGWALRPMK